MRIVVIIMLSITIIAPIVDIIITLWKERKEKKIRKERNKRIENSEVKNIKQATDALEQEPCNDAISRQIISDYVGSHIQEINTGYGDLNKHTNEILRMTVDYIDKMPSVTPQPKTGHWIEGQTDNPNIHNILCSCCLEGYPSKGHANSQYTREKFKYCPNCGAKMVEPQESEAKE